MHFLHIYKCLCLLLISNFTALSQAFENGTELQFKPLQDGECVQVVECRSERKNLILINIALVTPNDTLAWYNDKLNECKTSYLFSACVMEKGWAVVKVLVVPVEEKTWQFVCFISKFLPNGEIDNKPHFINITNCKPSTFPDTTVFLTNTSLPAIQDKSDKGVDIEVFVAVLVFLILGMAVTTSFMCIYFPNKLKRQASNREGVHLQSRENKIEQLEPRKEAYI